ncbi:MAG: DNA-3-methyladenine glycosylase I [Anaerolineales bacterium]|nr:DNA-3-methyladenine glycosylase I [Anaerolineales bacterium]
MTIEIPPREIPDNDDGYFEQLTKAIFRSGFSWRVIREKWPNFRQAFDDMNVDRVAAYDERDVDRLLSNEGIVRNGRKIEATIRNAQVFQQIIADHGSFQAYLRSMEGMDYSRRRDMLIKRFSHLGPTGAFVFMYSVGESVPSWEERNR